MKKVSIILVLLLSILVCYGTAAEKEVNDYSSAQTVFGGNDEIGYKEITVRPGEYFKVVLYAAGGTGYSWELDSNSVPSIEQVAKESMSISETHLAGGPVKWEFLFFVKAEAAEHTTLHFELKRPWESIKPVKQFDLAVKVEK